MKNVIAVVLAGLLGLAAPASAPATPMLGVAGYLAAQRPWEWVWGGGPATDDELLDIGLFACGQLGLGHTPEEVFTLMMGGPSNTPPAGSQAHTLGLRQIDTAQRYLCPQES